MRSRSSSSRRRRRSSRSSRSSSSSSGDVLRFLLSQLTECRGYIIAAINNHRTSPLPSTTITSASNNHQPSPLLSALPLVFLGQMTQAACGVLVFASFVRIRHEISDSRIFDMKFLIPSSGMRIRHEIENTLLILFRIRHEICDVLLLIKDSDD
jgi:hypothetical protein